MRFSGLLATYWPEAATDLDRAIGSTFDQTRPPDELVIVKDGPLPDEQNEVLDLWQSECDEPIITVELPDNRGLAEALQAGLEHCSYEYIARIDADDISVHDRFERQLDFFDAKPEHDVVGGHMREYHNDRETIRRVPTDPDEIVAYARRRCPLNHPTVMFRRAAIEDVGGYRNLPSMQDYDLWVRLLLAGYTIGNINEVLAETDADGELSSRRGGIDYARLEYDLQRRFYESGFTTRRQFVVNLCTRVPVRLLPNGVRRRVYSTFLRKTPIDATPRNQGREDGRLLARR